MPVITTTGALRARYAVLMVLLAAFLVAGACVVYTSYVQQQNNQKWCDVMTTLDRQNTPATTPQSVDFRRKIHKLTIGLGCGGTP
jgi:hypothetical protein